jgi:anthranilate synthase component 1
VEEFEEQVEKAKIGQIVSLVKTIEEPLDATEFFAKLSNYGKKKYSLLFESADIVPKYGEQSIGSASPCLKVSGRGAEFEITALNDTGLQYIKTIKKDLKFVDKLVHKKNILYGILQPQRKNTNEDDRIKAKTHFDILRTIAFKFKSADAPDNVHGGLFGAFGYDMIDQFEDLPKNEQNTLDTPDYELYYLDNLFVTDHKKGVTKIIVNALITEGNRKTLIQQAKKTMGEYEKTLEKKLVTPKKTKSKDSEIETDTTASEYEDIVSEIKNKIFRGDIFQAVPSRTLIQNTTAEPLLIYEKLKSINPSPYMFYIHQEDGILLGASPEMALRVQGNEQKIVEIRPIAGTKPRGLTPENAIDPDLDAKYEVELKTDKKEIAEHTMLIDLARNDIARVSEPGTRFCNEPFVIEKYSHVQHLVSNVQGTLKEGLDALHAYLATMNMGTLTGAPKVEAMKLIRTHEKESRGFYGGAVGYITPEGNMDTTITIRSMYLRANKAYIRAGAGIVHDSIPEQEFQETEKKAQACLKALEMAEAAK